MLVQLVLGAVGIMVGGMLGWLRWIRERKIKILECMCAYIVHECKAALGVSLGERISDMEHDHG
jgi:hypothetical protein